MSSYDFDFARDWLVNRDEQSGNLAAKPCEMKEEKNKNKTDQ